MKILGRREVKAKLKRTNVSNLMLGDNEMLKGYIASRGPEWAVEMVAARLAPADIADMFLHVV